MAGLVPHVNMYTHNTEFGRLQCLTLKIIENIELPHTLLSRFGLIFLMLDTRWRLTATWGRLFTSANAMSVGLEMARCCWQVEQEKITPLLPLSHPVSGMSGARYSARVRCRRTPGGGDMR